MNEAIFRTINQWSDSLRFLVFFSDGIKRGDVRIALGILVIAMLWRPGPGRTAMWQSLVAWPLANGLTDILKATLPQARPCVELPDVLLRTGMLTSFGTASAHSANMAAIATVWCWRLGWKWGSIWIVIALLTGVSRIYVGVHYPGQVLLGWLCGCAVASLVCWTIDRIVAARQPVLTGADGEPA